ncbi:hypothetical protein KQ875_02060 [Mycoplasma zalophi]|uniref:Multidrug transporter n=2 Tax=Mycoplasma zalophi TaxID=191287 RepID=A0ABS6DQF4_9MOLU|nr:hypothetical protein [Mycoplasma zalophi]
MVIFRRTFENINIKMFFALLFFGLLPTIYNTVRIYWLGQIPDTWAFSIAAQMQWINLLYEILQESFILPLFFFVGAVIFQKEKLINRLKTGMLFSFSIYLLLTIIILSAARPLATAMATNNKVIDQTVTYVRLESIANIINIMFRFILVSLITMKKTKNIYIPLVLQLFLIIILDIFFVSNLSVSLNLGINGVAFTNIIVSSILLIVGFILLYVEKINIWKYSKLDFKWFKKFIPISALSGLETLVRNLFFMFMVIKMVNMVGSAGDFWVTNNFIWGWLLLPIIQLGELIKAEIGINKDNAIKKNTLGYFIIVTAIVLIWFITIPGWDLFLKHVMGLSNHKIVLHLALISIAFYVTFAYNNVIDSIFYGLGKTNYMLFQSLFVNITFYGLMFILYKTNIWIPTLDTIALMFAGGTAIDSILTYVMFCWVLRKRKINIFAILKK